MEREREREKTERSKWREKSKEYRESKRNGVADGERETNRTER